MDGGVDRDVNGDDAEASGTSRHWVDNSVPDAPSRHWAAGNPQPDWMSAWGQSWVLGLLLGALPEA